MKTSPYHTEQSLQYHIDYLEVCMHKVTCELILDRLLKHCMYVSRTIPYQFLVNKGPSKGGMDQNQPEEEFVEDLPEYLRCPICLCCLSNPYQVSWGMCAGSRLLAPWTMLVVNHYKYCNTVN